MASSMQMRSTWHTQPPKPPFGELFQACALTSPVTFLTGDHVHKSDLTRSRLRLRPKRSGYDINAEAYVYGLSTVTTRDWSN